MCTPPTLTALLLDHGYAVLFWYVMLAQAGLPLPCGPLIMAAGALAATGHLRLAAVVGVVELGSLCADVGWYFLGRSQGARVLRVLCLISLEPEVCVQRTRHALGRYGGLFLLLAKFIPGLGLLAAPITGERRMAFARFLALDSLGILTWASTYALVGFFLAEWLGRSARVLQTGANFGLGAILAVALAFVLFRVVRNLRFRLRARAPRSSR